METETVARRRLKPEWVQACLRELTEAERQLIWNALGGIPNEPSHREINEYWSAAQRGDLGCWIVRDEHEQIAAATFFRVEQFRDGSQNFFSCGTIAIGAGDRQITDTDMAQMEALARRLDCRSMSMKTHRPGLVKKLSAQPGWFVSEVFLRKIL